MTKARMEKLLKRIYFHRRRLQDALNEAHSAELIKYSEWKEGPCQALDEVLDRLEKTTQAQISQIIHLAARQSVWK